MAQQSAESMLETEAETIGFVKEWLHENEDLILWEVIMQDLARDKPELPKHQCGDCAAYKTPFCHFGSHHDVITKKDKACAGFYPDRHIPRKKLKKRIVQRRVE